MKGSIYADQWNAETVKAVMNLQGPILVVGASGFIGARLFHSLIKHRKDVYGASKNIHQSWRMSRLPASVLKDSLHTLDVTHLAGVKHLFARLRPKTIFNLSAYGAYERQSDALRAHQVNYIGTLNLLMAAEEIGCAAFVHAGSSSEYGINCKGPSENDELVPNSDYAASKAATSALIKFYGRIKNFPVANLRLYSIYGPWEEHDRLIPKVVASGLQGEFPAFASAAISRDFVYVDDCTQAMVLAALRLVQKEPGISLNVASGVKTTLADIAALSKKIFGIKCEPGFGTMTNRKWDLTEWFGSPTLIEQKLNWRASTSLAIGLRLAAEWQKSAQDVLINARVVKTSKKVSAIIACYLDHQAIPFMHQRLTETFEKLGVDYEIIFVNDCSPASDEQVIADLCNRDPHVIGISHSRNFGSQSAFLSGMEIATGDAVVLLDGDLQDPPELIEDFYQRWNEGFDVVYGIRVKREAPAHMQILYKVFYRVFKSMANISIPLDAGDFSLIDRKLVRHLLQMHEKDIFLRGLRAWLGFKQVGVPYVRAERMFGVSTNNFLKNIWWTKKAIFSFSTKPLEYIQRLSVLIFGASFLLAGFYLVNYFVNPPANTNGSGKGTTTIIVLLLILSATILFAISILGDYLGKVLEEVKARPRFVKAKILRMGETLSTEHEIREFIKTTGESNG